MTAIWWIRRHLRLQDNLTLLKALDNAPILPAFILDQLLMEKAPVRKREFLFSTAAVQDKDDTITDSVGVMLDLTEKNRAVSERVQREKLQGVLETAGERSAMNSTSPCNP